MKRARQDGPSLCSQEPQPIETKGAVERISEKLWPAESDKVAATLRVQTISIGHSEHCGVDPPAVEGCQGWKRLRIAIGGGSAPAADALLDIGEVPHSYSTRSGQGRSE